MKVNIKRELPPEAWNGEYVAIDLEIYGIPEGKLHRPVGTFACMSICLGRETVCGSAYVPTVYQIYDAADIPGAIERIDKGKWIFQNAKFDVRQMRRWATIEPRKIWDTMVVEQGLFGGYYSGFGLDALSLRWLHEYVDKEPREEFQTAKEMSPEMQEYAALDPWITLRVALAQMKYIEDNDVSMDHYWKADHPAVWAILDMPPVRMDVDGWHNLATEFMTKAEEVQAKYTDINLNSAAQVNKRMAEYLGARGKLDTVDEEALLGMRDKFAQRGKHEITTFIDDVLALRGFRKNAGTYGDNWLNKHIEGDCIFANWKPVQALTGRMACGEPNLQNVPQREYPIYRTFFIASPGNIILVADVQQQEPRITAKLSGDRYLTDAICAGISSHVIVGQRVFGDPDFSKKSPRYLTAKTLNLGLSYGLTAAGLAKKAGISEDEAEQVVKDYFKAFPGIAAYIDEYRKIAWRKGYVETLLGRRSWINPHTRKWENNAINSPVQGTGGDQMKIAIGFVHQESKARGLPFCLSMVVHDEMVCDVPKEIKAEYKTLVDDAWQEAGQMTLGDTIPIVMEFAEGPNWGCKNEAH